MGFEAPSGTAISTIASRVLTVKIACVILVQEIIEVRQSTDNFDKFPKTRDVDPLINPYSPGAGTFPPALVGRNKLIESFEITLRRTLAARSARSLLPLGLRGVGKTVLLINFCGQAEKLKFKIAMIEASEDGDFANVLGAALRTILYELDRLEGVSAAVKRGLRVLKSFSVTPHLDSMPTFTVDLDPERGQADSGNLGRDLTDLVVAVGTAAKDRGVGLLISIDEIQYLNREELAAIITAMHRSAQLNLPVVMVGAGLPLIAGLAGQAKSYAERLFDFPEIDSLAPHDAREAIEKPALDLGVRFNDKALDEIVTQTHGYPYFIQVWAHEVWNAAAMSPISLEDVVGVRDVVNARLDAGFFRVRYDRLNRTERRYLRALAELGPGVHRSGEIAEQYGAKVQTVAPTRASLISKGMIFSRQHGDTAFTVPLFDEFMRRLPSED
jgi:hypothetical protein